MTWHIRHFSINHDTLPTAMSGYTADLIAELRVSPEAHGTTEPIQLLLPGCKRVRFLKPVIFATLIEKAGDKAVTDELYDLFP